MKIEISVTDLDQFNFLGVILLPQALARWEM